MIFYSFVIRRHYNWIDRSRLLFNYEEKASGGFRSEKNQMTYNGVNGVVKLLFPELKASDVFICMAKTKAERYT